MRVLDVCGGHRRWPIPVAYWGWERVIVDNNLAFEPDYLCDVGGLDGVVPPQSFDVVLFSHALEHFSPHRQAMVIRMLRWGLRPGGYLHFVVPDVRRAVQQMVELGHDLDDIVYDSPAGAISYQALIYGFPGHVEAWGEGMCHRTGFSAPLLVRLLEREGLDAIQWFTNSGFEIHALAWASAAGLDSGIWSTLETVIRSAGARSPR